MLRALASVAAQPAAPASRLLLIYAFAIGAGQGIHAVMALLLDANFRIGERQIGTVFTWIGAISVFARVFLLGWLIDRLGEARLSRLGLVVLATAIGGCRSQLARGARARGRLYRSAWR
jgi:nitrate/nitrite transporter NarK